MKFQTWTIRTPDAALTRRLEARGVSPLSALTLASRGVSEEDALRFLHCGAEELHDPFSMRGMAQAVRRIRRALEQNELICVYGDYDVDGITAACLLTTYLKSVGGHVLTHIPDRLKEGYSLNRGTLELLREQGVRLIITVDCGITNLEEADYASALRMDLVVTDHHECKPRLPLCCAVVNPHQPDCLYPCKQLAGVGVALKLVQALDSSPDRAGRERIFRAYADLAAIGTVADVMELTGENRFIVRAGLQELRHTARPGLRALLREAGMEGKELNATSISYSLAPRLNAAGRMGCPDLAVRLLLTERAEEAEALAKELCGLNRERQEVELEIFQQCVAQLQQRVSPPEGVLILAGEHWHQGVVGIVASRLVERYHLPVMMICMENGRGKGSCRSPAGFNLFAALEECSDLLETFGGHEQAAGFTITAQALPEFRRRMLVIAKQQPPDSARTEALEIDAALPTAQLLTPENVAALGELEPFGAGNPRPTFLLERLRVISFSGIGGGKHTRVQLARDGELLNGVFFSAAPGWLALRPGMEVDAAFYPQMNHFRGVTSVQLVLSDLRRSRASAPLQLYYRYTRGNTLTLAEAQSLLPGRQDFVALWRVLVREGQRKPIRDSAEAFLARAVVCPEEYRERAESRALFCLEVFRERGLIDFSLDGSSGVYIALRPIREKVDLESSEPLCRLKRRLEESE